MFLATGLWALIAGKLPAGLLRLLFGKGEYQVPTARARLYGLILASPLPAAFLVSALLRVILGSKVTGPAIAFEYFYLVTIIIASIFVTRSLRRPIEARVAEASVATEPGRRPEISYATRLVIIFGLAVLTFITLVAAGSLVMTIVSLLRFGGTVTGDFSKDFLPFIIVTIVVALGVFGSIKLIKLLKR